MRKQTKEFTPTTAVKIRRLKKYGDCSRAVVATRDIEEGELIEACPVIRMKNTEVFGKTNPLPTVSWYVFYWDEDPKLCSTGMTALALGYGSLYNHSADPNARFERVNNDCLRIFAKRRIKKGEEVTIHYQQEEPDSWSVEFPMRPIRQ